MQMSDTCGAPHLPSDDVSARRRSLLPGSSVEEIAETFRVLGDPTRVRILDALARGELCVCDLAALVGISESAASHQLRLLRGMRLVRPRRAGRQIFYSVDDHHILELLRQAATHVEESPAAMTVVDASPAAMTVVDASPAATTIVDASPAATTIVDASPAATVPYAGSRRS